MVKRTKMKAGSITKEMVERAIQMRREGQMTWAQVGARLALLYGRKSAFTEKAMATAVNDHISGKVVRK